MTSCFESLLIIFLLKYNFLTITINKIMIANYINKLNYLITLYY